MLSYIPNQCWPCGANLSGSMPRHAKCAKEILQRALWLKGRRRHLAFCVSKLLRLILVSLRLSVRVQSTRLDAHEVSSALRSGAPYLFIGFALSDGHALCARLGFVE